MLIPLPWLAEFTPLGGRDGQQVAAALVSVGLEEEAVYGSGVTGPLVAGQVVEVAPEAQKNGKTINWCQVDVGSEHGGVRGIVCGADNFTAGDKVVVALPGAVLPGPFPISARKTYGHVSDGMICSARELGLGEDHDGIIVLARIGQDPAVGADLIPLLHLDEQTVEINVTPDRGYCFSIRGVAREFSHATGEAFTDPALVLTPPATASGFAVELDDAAPIHGRPGCDRFVARVVRGCDAFRPSPDWLRRRLTQAGMRPIALAVDVTNYVMLELGQPLHAYDLHGVAEPIVVRRALAGERLVTLDDVDRALDPEDLLITDSPGGRPASRVLGLAGVMGGASSEITESTRDLLIEAAHFDPVTVARTSRRHKLGSEAARRFERGADPELPPKAVQRVIDLLVEYGGGAADLDVTDAGFVRPQPAISFDPGYPARLVGVDYSPARVRQVLEEIGCQVDDAAEPGSPAGAAFQRGALGDGPDRSGALGADGRADWAEGPGAAAGAGAWSVTPPSWRPDLTRAVDLVEEVARIDGYAKIPSQVASAPAGGGLTKAQRLRRSVARSLADFGLVEVLSYPFVGEGVFDALGYPPEDGRRQAVRLANPLDAAAPLLRTAILQTLLGVARRNAARGLTDAGLFEIGLVTEAPPIQLRAPMLRTDARPSNEELAAVVQAVPDQPRHAAGLLMGYRVRPGVWGPGRGADWADAVQAVKVAGQTAGVSLTASQDQVAPFHPGRCARLMAGEAPIGHAGELHPAVVREFGLPAGAVGFEIDLDRLIELAPDIVAARTVSPQPLAKEDLAFVVPRSLPAAELVAAVRTGAGSLVEDAFVFDVYQGDQIPADKKSIAVALRLRAADHTLSPEEIAAARAGAIKQAARLGATLRT
ncbi:MAG: phenylalanine--tRNA ligase subunit beta [Bifidobacteriaceae bacterium]|jgi:phenylalanyl-tRNA synthetase beta chain|nr:phenylalanine--tRNA ligase subunit beta [Bifidobacteriaceae bacterium]